MDIGQWKLHLVWQIYSKCVRERVNVSVNCCDIALIAVAFAVVVVVANNDCSPVWYAMLSCFIVY